MCLPRYVEVLLIIDIQLVKGIQFLFENYRVYHHPVSNNVYFGFMENSRRYGVQHMFQSIEFKCMAGIWATLEPGYHIVFGSQYIHYLSFSFVAPLEAEQYINFHKFLLIGFCFFIMLFPTNFKLALTFQ